MWVTTAPVIDERTEEASDLTTPWATVVWNDPVTLMSYVTHVFMTYFGYSHEKAENLMWQVHRLGRAIVSQGGREQMETDVQAMQGYGLWSSMERT